MSDSNHRLLERLAELVRRDRGGEARLVEVLGEVDARRLYLERAYSSMFEFCVRELRFAEGVAYKRIAVARVAQRHPEILAALASGEIHLTGACLIAPHLDGGVNSGVDGVGRVDGGAATGVGAADVGAVGDWLELARHATVREIKQRIADRKPRPTPSTFIRRLTKGSGVGCVGTPGCGEVELPRGGLSIRNVATKSADSERFRARCEPLGTGRYAIRLVVEEPVYEQLEELRALMRHSIPDGDLGRILTQSIGVLLDRVRKQKFGVGVGGGVSVCIGGGIGSESNNTNADKADKADSASTEDAAATSGPGVGRQRLAHRTGSAPPSRHIPVAIRRAVWARDGGRCRFVSRRGKSCGARDCLEFHHAVPWARCREHSVENIELRCRAHNQYEAISDFGTEKMVRYQRERAAR